VASVPERQGCSLTPWGRTRTGGRVADVHFGVIALHDLIGMTVGHSPGMMLSCSLAAGGLSMTWRVVKGISAPRPMIRIAQVHDLLLRYTPGP